MPKAFWQLKNTKLCNKGVFRSLFSCNFDDQICYTQKTLTRHNYQRKVSNLLSKLILTSHTYPL